MKMGSLSLLTLVLFAYVMNSISIGNTLALKCHTCKQNSNSCKDEECPALFTVTDVKATCTGLYDGDTVIKKRCYPAETTSKFLDGEKKCADKPGFELEKFEEKVEAEMRKIAQEMTPEQQHAAVILYMSQQGKGRSGQGSLDLGKTYRMCTCSTDLCDPMSSGTNNVMECEKKYVAVTLLALAALVSRFFN